MLQVSPLGAQLASSFCISALSTRATPSTETTEQPQKIGTRFIIRWAIQRAPRKAKSTRLAKAGNFATQSRLVFGVTTAATVPPKRRISEATKKTNGPVPETMVCCPSGLKFCLKSAVAPAKPKTPGFVQPGIGCTNSCAPVANTRALVVSRSTSPSLRT